MFERNLIQISLPVIAILLAGTASIGNEAKASDGSIYEIIGEREQLETLTLVATESEMHRYLHHDGPFTLMAPTDVAMDELPADELADVMQEQQSQREFINDHLFQGEHGAEDIQHILNGGEVVETIEAENGIIHIIDTVVEDVEE